MSGQCKHCGTLTGIHGFSFNSLGEYTDDVQDYEKRIVEGRRYEDAMSAEEFKQRYDPKIGGAGILMIPHELDPEYEGDPETHDAFLEAIIESMSRALSNPPEVVWGPQPTLED